MAGAAGAEFLGTMYGVQQAISTDSPLVAAFGGGANRFATGPDRAMFWSGIGRGGDAVAANIAKQEGRVTLEMTRANRGFELPTFDPNNPAAVAAWRQASHDFATGASGNVRVLQGDFIRIDSSWAKTEFPALRANPNVKSITAIDAKTGAEVLLWSR